MAGIKPQFALAMTLATAAVYATAGVPAAKQAQTSTFEQQFRNPPNSARPRVWWHWMAGNITKDGIEKDLQWMKRVGIGGLQKIDANLITPQIVNHPLVYMTPGWKDAFRFAASESDRLGLKLGIASSPGWSETGGPWVAPKDGLKKVVWSQTDITGGKHFSGKLPMPPPVTGPFQTIPKQHSLLASTTAKPQSYYADIAVLAYPEKTPPATSTVTVTDGSGKPLDNALLGDADLQSGVDLAVKAASGKHTMLLLNYTRARTVRSATLFIPGGMMRPLGPLYKPRLEASEDGVSWHGVADIPVADVPTTVSFAPVTARHFRIVFYPAKSPALPFSAAAPGVAFSKMFGGMAQKMAERPIHVGDFTLSSRARIDHFEAKAGFTLVPDYYALNKGLANTKGIAPGKVIDLTSRVRPDGTLVWTPPPGHWRILRLGYSLLGTTNHPATPQATGLEVDKFDGKAVRRYMEHYLAMYRDTVGPKLMGAHGVRTLVTDSIEVGAANWTPDLIAQFKKLRGYDPTPWLPALTGTIIGSREQSNRFLYDFRRTLADLMATQHYRTVAEVAHKYGLKVYGEALEDGRPSLGDDMAMRRYTDVPMSAMWCFPLKQGPKPTYLADDKGAASVAHIYGQKLVAAESMTSAMAPWAYGPAELRHVIDLEFALGINRPVIHTSVHVPVDNKVPGLSLFIFGQYFNRNESWAPLAKPWVDYIARNSFMLQQGRNVADVGYFYGEGPPLTGLYDKHPVADAPQANAFDFVNDDALMHALSDDGHDLVTPGGARYRVLYLGGTSREMTLTTLRRIADLVEGGATVVGLAPKGNPSLAGNRAEYAALVKKLWPGGTETRVGKGRVIASTDIESALRRVGVAPDFRYTGGTRDSNIPFVHRKLAEGDIYYLVNRTDRAESIEAHFRVTGKAPMLWHADTGTSEPVSYRIEIGETVVPLDLRGEESLFVVFRKPAKVKARTVHTPNPVELASLKGPWQVHFQANRGAPAAAVFKQLAPLNENSNPGIKYFSGIATYTRTFSTPQGWKPGEPLWLDLGEVHEVAKVLVNGKVAGSAWHSPYRIDIGKAAKPGRNRLAIKVADLWVNRLIGDAQPGARKVTWTALPTYSKDAPLRRSGLIGPVRLLGLK